MIGEFDFDDLFNSPDITVPGVTWFIFIVFVIVMTLILMNLLVRFAGRCQLQSLLFLLERQMTEETGANKSFPSCPYLCFRTSLGVQPFIWK